MCQWQINTIGLREGRAFSLISETKSPALRTELLLHEVQECLQSHWTLFYQAKNCGLAFISGPIERSGAVSEAGWHHCKASELVPVGWQEDCLALSSSSHGGWDVPGIITAALWGVCQSQQFQRITDLKRANTRDTKRSVRGLPANTGKGTAHPNRACVLQGEPFLCLQHPGEQHMWITVPKCRTASTRNDAEVLVLRQAAPAEVSELQMIHSSISHDVRQAGKGGWRRGAVWWRNLCQAPGSHQSVPGLSLAPQLQVLSPQDSTSQGTPETQCGWGRKYFERQKHIKMFSQEQGVKKAAHLLFLGFFF